MGGVWEEKRAPLASHLELPALRPRHASIGTPGGSHLGPPRQNLPTGGLSLCWGRGDGGGICRRGGCGKLGGGGRSRWEWLEARLSALYTPLAPRLTPLAPRLTPLAPRLEVCATGGGVRRHWLVCCRWKQEVGQGGFNDGTRPPDMDLHVFCQHNAREFATGYHLLDGGGVGWVQERTSEGGDGVCAFYTLSPSPHFCIF